MRTETRLFGFGLTFGASLFVSFALSDPARGLEVWFGDPIVSQLPASTTGSAFAVGHFDADVHWDCAVGANQGAGRSLLIYHGDGSGAMTLGDQIPCPTSQVVWKALVAGDFNGDGRLDLAASREPTGIYYQGPGGFSSDPELIYLNGAPAMYELLVAADLDNDGFDDLVGLQPRYVYPKSRVYIYWGESSGLATDPTVLQVQLYPENANCEPGGWLTWLYEGRARDVNGDGRLDIAMFAVYSEPDFCGDRDGIGWFENLGQREFAEEAQWAVLWDEGSSGTVDRFDIGRIDGDAYPDLVRSEHSTFEAFVYLGDASQQFTLLGLVEPGFSDLPILFDANLDGVLDLRKQDTITEIFRGVGDGTFEAVQSLGGRLKESHACDVIPLGGPDLIGIGTPSTSIVVYPNVTGTTAGIESAERPRSSLVATPSVSSAGVRLEVIAASAGEAGSGPTAVSVVGADGSRVRKLDMARAAAGSWTADWDGRDELGRRVPAGVYFARVDGVDSAARFTIVR